MTRAKQLPVEQRVIDVKPLKGGSVIVEKASIHTTSKFSFANAAKALATKHEITVHIVENGFIELRKGKNILQSCDNWKGHYRFMCGYDLGVKSKKK